MLENKQLSQVATTASSTYSKSQKAAIHMSSCGFPVIPLVKKSKRPAYKGWRDIKPTPSPDVSEMTEAYGVAIPRDVLVVDIDPRNFEEDAEQPGTPVDWFFKRCGVSFPANTFVVRSGGHKDGYHIFMKKPPEVLVRHTLSEFPGLEFKTHGRFVVGYHSTHSITGRDYEVVTGSPDGLMDCPEEVLAVIRREERDRGEDLDYQEDEATKTKYISYLQQAPESVMGHNGDATTLKVAMKGRDLGLPSTVTLELMAQYYNPHRCMPMWQYDELEAKVNNAYAYAKRAIGNSHPKSIFNEYISSDRIGNYDPADRTESFRLSNLEWDVTRDNTYKPTLNNTVNFMLLPSYKSFKNPLYNLFRYNEFNYTLEFTGSPPWRKVDDYTDVWMNDDDVFLKYHLNKAENFDTNNQLCIEAALIAGKKNAYHPMREYFNNLEWDGVPRLDSLFPKYAGSPDNDYTRAAGRCMMIAAVARTFKPGTKFDHVVILEGPQGTGKSEFCRQLCPDPKWYLSAGKVDPGNKDTFKKFHNFFIVELAELEVLNKVSVQALKAFITVDVDVLRPAYGRVDMNFPRQFIFIGTYNPLAGVGYLGDGTGNRRFWPVQTGRIDIEALKQDRDQLWAEAVHRYRAGEPHYFKDQNLLKLAQKEQKARMVVDPWEDIIDAWMATEKEMSRPINRISTQRLFRDALGLRVSAANRREYARLTTVMDGLGYERKKIYCPIIKRSMNGFSLKDFERGKTVDPYREALKNL